MAHVDVHTDTTGAPPRERKRAALHAGTSTTEALVAAGAVVLAILGLLGVIPATLAAIATIGAGAVLMLEGSQVALRVQHAFDEMTTEREEGVQIGNGISTEVLGGAAAVALGILALVGIDSMPLLAVAQIVLGGALVVGASALPAVEDATRGTVLGDRYRQLAHVAVLSATGPRTLAGAASIVLGILLLAHVGTPLTFILVSLLCVGGGLLLTGTVLGVRMASALR